MPRRVLSLLCAAMLVGGGGVVPAQETTAPPKPAVEPEAATLSPDQLDSLVAPIALFPDPLLAQTLVASTYPLEIVQLHQWLAKHSNLKDQALADAVAKQPWDPSIQSMAATPEVVKRLADDIQWTTELGNVFLAQQSDVMDSVQRMRQKAKDKGALESNEQQKVETKVVEDKTVIVVESADPEVVYVPSYSPTVVYGPPVYPYPPIYYPPYYAGGAFVSFSFGIMVGAAWGGSCCYCGWGSNDIDINVDNNFNRNNIEGGGRDGNWKHNPEHRGGAPYGDRATANKYGGAARGDTARTRQPSAGQQPARTGGGAPSAGTRPAGTGDRAGSPSAGTRPSGSGSPSAGTRPSGSGGDRVGSRDIPSRPSSSTGALGSSGGYGGAQARSYSSRGASSMGSRGGASMGSRGGGGGGGGGRRR